MRVAKMLCDWTFIGFGQGLILSFIILIFLKFLEEPEKWLDNILMYSNNLFNSLNYYVY